jgi:Ca2+-binding RTX toxin-like protein
MMKRLQLVVALALGCAGALLMAAPAGAVVSCVYTSGDHKATVTFDPVNPNGEYVTIGRSGTAIQANFANCGSATVSNTNTVVVTGGPGRQHLSVDLLGGPFEPGFTPEGGGVSEIEIQVNLKAGTDSLTISGGLGDDTLTLGTSGANMNGDGDVDVITPNGVEEISMYGNDGLDTLSAAGGLGAGGALEQRVFLIGGDGNDAITGSDGPDYIDGSSDADTLAGGAGNDDMIGGSGVDSLEGGLDQDGLEGNQGNDTLDGGPDDDYFYANADPDGNDVFSGGDGTDVIDYSIRGTAALNVNLDGVANDGRVGSEFDNVNQDVENVYGSNGPNVLTGTAADNTLGGRDGADTLNGGGGDDFLSGEPGADTLNGGDGHDSLYGSSGSDQLNGQSGNDTLSGGADNDTQTGGTGADNFYSGSTLDGADDMSGGAGIDFAWYSGRTGNLTITMSGNNNDGLPGELDNVRPDIENLTAGSGADSLTGSSANNQIDGGSGNDVLGGGDGRDTLFGGNDDDTLTGGDGEDSMYGGNGSDHFSAEDGGNDWVYGGSDAGIDVVDNSDPFDNILEVP